ncbi:hypothetical protein RISK_002650 [Rhodopirellula islandica]|uniref:Uncharacterized protein n=1 Tax=Rhodopirellula islandica TaxID=595434 RepID=A0A0J1BFD5_RHOIS|nr:hypothetical protein RISK_002650 [Rhodopirellula islandica]
MYQRKRSGSVGLCGLQGRPGKHGKPYRQFASAKRQRLVDRFG